MRHEGTEQGQEANVSRREWVGRNEKKKIGKLKWKQ
jgi:hypothetical protein